MKKGIDAPALDRDAMMLQRFNHEVHEIGKIERRIVANLCEYLKAEGFEIRSVYDGVDDTPVHNDTKAAMELIFNLDEASLRVCRPGAKGTHGIWLVMGNDGDDIIADWNYFADDRDGFNAAMDGFNVEDYAQIG